MCKIGYAIIGITSARNDAVQQQSREPLEASARLPLACCTCTTLLDMFVGVMHQLWLCDWCAITCKQPAEQAARPAAKLPCVTGVPSLASLPAEQAARPAAKLPFATAMNPLPAVIELSTSLNCILDLECSSAGLLDLCC